VFIAAPTVTTEDIFDEKFDHVRIESTALIAL
jgi:hypothetical protein